MQNTIIDRMLITEDLHGDTSALTLIAKKCKRKTVCLLLEILGIFSEIITVNVVFLMTLICFFKEKSLFGLCRP